MGEPRAFVQCAPDPPLADDGYRVKLFVLRLPTPEMAIARVAHRVWGGGKFTSNHLIIVKFCNGWRHFENVYRDLVND